MTLKFWDLSDGRTELFFNNQDAKGYKGRGGGGIVGLYGLLFAFLRHIDLRTPF